MTVKQLRQVQWSKICVYCHCICCNVSFITTSCQSWRLKISPQFQNIHILLCQVFQAIRVNINVHVKAIKLWSYSAYAIFIQTKTAMDRGMLEKSLLYKKNVLSSPSRCSILTRIDDVFSKEESSVMVFQMGKKLKTPLLFHLWGMF